MLVSKNTHPLLRTISFYKRARIMSNIFIVLYLSELSTFLCFLNMKTSRYQNISSIDFDKSAIFLTRACLA